MDRSCYQRERLCFQTAATEEWMSSVETSTRLAEKGPLSLAGSRLIGRTDLDQRTCLARRLGEVAVKGLSERKPGLARELAERRTSFAEQEGLGTRAE